MKTYEELPQCFSVGDDGISKIGVEIAVEFDTQWTEGAWLTCPKSATFDLHLSS